MPPLPYDDGQASNHTVPIAADTADKTAADRQPVGRPKTIDQSYLDRLRELVTHSPKIFGYGFNRWTAYWLRQHLLAEFQVAVSERHINRLLRQMGLSTRQRIQICQGKPSYRHSIEITDLSQEYLNQVSQSS